MSYTQVIRQLLENGCAVVPASVHGISSTQITDGCAAGVELVHYLADLSCETCLTRPGESEPDALLIKRDGTQKKDLKYFLHISQNVRDLIGEHPELMAALECKNDALRAVQRLDLEINVFVQKFLKALQLKADGLFGGVDLASAFRQTIHRSIPNSSTMLRYLWYPPEPGQAGASAHIDRCFLTVHFGDEGGTLLGHRAWNGGDTFVLSPAPGDLSLFWGVKAFMASNARLFPLKHSSTASVTMPRTAMVKFCHLPIGRVTDAGEALDAFCAAKGIDNYSQLYAKQFANANIMASQ